MIGGVIMVRKMLLLSTGSLALVLATPSAATTLDGWLDHSGNAANYFDPAVGYVPAGYGNSSSNNGVTIGTGIEFAFKDGVLFETADFTPTGFTINRVVGSPLYITPYTMRFTASDGYFNGLTLLSDSFGGTYSVVGNVFTYYAPLFVGAGTSSVVFRVAASGVPEPASWAMLIVGFGAIGFGMRRRSNAVTATSTSS